MLWPLAVYEVPVSTVEKLERVTAYVKKWLRVKRCLTTISLYGDCVLKLPDLKLLRVSADLQVSGNLFHM